MWTEGDTTMDGGGGSMFMDNSIAGGSTSGRATNAQRGQNCVPVMIKHILRHGEELQIWGMPAKLITFVALVRSIQDVSTKVTFIFEDETGSIKGIKWLEADATSFQCPVNLHSYARIHGMIRNQQNETFVLVVNLQPIEHANELLAHLMEVTMICLEGEKLVGQVKNSDNTFVNRSANVSGMNMNAEDNSGLSRDQALVLNIIRSDPTEYGAERQDIKSKVPPHVASKVDEILEFLSSEGHVYTTKTDDHFKVI